MNLYFSTAMILSSVIFAYCHQLSTAESIQKEITYYHPNKETIKKKKTISFKESPRETVQSLPEVNELDLFKLSIEVKSLYNLYKSTSSDIYFDPQILR